MGSNHSAQVVSLDTRRRTPAGLTIVRRAPDTPFRVMGTGDSKRDAILADEGILDSMRSVIRARGVREADIDDVLHDVIEAVCRDDNLPLDDKEQARLYLCGVARYKSIDNARARKRHLRRHSERDVDSVHASQLPADEVALAHKLDAHGKKTFPFTYAWFQRFAIGGETHAEIAADPQVTAGHVANELSNIRHALRAFALAAFAVLLGAATAHFWRPGAPPGGAPVAHSPAPAPKAPPVPSALPIAPQALPAATALRDRATRECANGHWSECLTDLDEASKIDPNGESPEVRELHAQAVEATRSLEAKPLR